MLRADPITGRADSSSKRWPNVHKRRPPRIYCADLPKQPDADQPRAVVVTRENQQPVTEVA